MLKDPVCGMVLLPETVFVIREYQGETFYFCTQECVDKFDADPETYRQLETRPYNQLRID